jgi:hypothetical protein
MPEFVPRDARWMLRLAASREDRDALLDDLAQEATTLAHAEGPAAARRWARRQVLRSVAPLIGRRIEIAVKKARRTSMNGWRGFG